ncbi:MAG: hypothetical protein SFX73_20805 [Kofleriaceae bacterium]|nr:hypothetical protein [Kofleriaceae bacterium]
MATVRGSLFFLVLVGLLGSAVAQPAQPAPAGPPAPAKAPAPAPAKAPLPPRPRPNVPALVGLTEVVKLNPPSGFIDDVVTGDAQRIAYVVADTAGMTELHVYTHATKLEHVVDIAPITTRPVALHLVGPRVFVVGKNEDGTQNAALVELEDTAKTKAGSAVYKVGPANNITVITRDGKQRIAVHKAAAVATGTKHTVELLALENGKRVSAGKPFALDGKNTLPKLELTVNHWSDGFTRAHGIKAGVWNRKENARDPDSEASYDLVTGKLYDIKKIENLMEQRKRFQALAGQPRQELVRMAWDNSAVEVWSGNKLHPVTLDEPITNYDPSSIQGVVTNADGSAWIALKVDPVNVEAVARKKADPEYLDIFRVGADGRAVRKGRVLSHLIRHHFGVVGDQFWLLERLSSTDRGSRSLTVYQPQ